MIYFYERDAVEMRIEARLDAATQIYTIIRRMADGTAETELVWGEEPCRRRLESIGADLFRDGWRSSRPPMFLVR